MSKPVITVEDTLCKILSVSLSPSELTILYNINVTKATFNRGQEIEVTYPTGDELYSIGAVSYPVNANVERPIQVRANGETSLNRTANDLQLLQIQLDTLQQICKELNLFFMNFELEPFRTTSYKQDKEGIRVYADKLFNGTLLKKNDDFSAIVQLLQRDLIESELISDIRMSSTSRTISSASKIKKLLDSLYPACDLEVKMPGKTVDDKNAVNAINVRSSKLYKVFKKYNINTSGK